MDCYSLMTTEMESVQVIILSRPLISVVGSQTLLFGRYGFMIGVIASYFGEGVLRFIYVVELLAMG